MPALAHICPQMRGKGGCLLHEDVVRPKLEETDSGIAGEGQE